MEVYNQTMKQMASTTIILEEDQNRFVYLLQVGRPKMTQGDFFLRGLCLICKAGLFHLVLLAYLELIPLIPVFRYQWDLLLMISIKEA